MLGTKSLRIYLATQRIDHMIYEEKPSKSWSNLQANFSQNISPNAVDLMDKILQYNPDARMKASEAMHHVFL